MSRNLSEGMEFSGGPDVGALLVECPVRLSSGGPGFLTDLVGEDFVLLCFVEGPATPAGADALDALTSGMRRRQVPFHVLTLGRMLADTGGRDSAADDGSGSLFVAYDARPGTTYLLGPDGRVLGRWRELDPAAVTASIGRVLEGG